MTEAACVRERSWVEDDRWWYERIYADGSKRVACRLASGPREEDEMKWGTHSPLAMKRQQTKTAKGDKREMVSPRIDELLQQFERSDIDAETMAYAAYALGWGDVRHKNGHTPEVQT